MNRPLRFTPEILDEDMDARLDTDWACANDNRHVYALPAKPLTELQLFGLIAVCCAAMVGLFAVCTGLMP